MTRLEIIQSPTIAARHRDYTFLGTTQSLCPECLAVVPAKIIARRGRVYFRKTCQEHGERDDFICSDVKCPRSSAAWPTSPPRDWSACTTTDE